MRTSILLSAFLGLTTIGCVGTVDGTGGPGPGSGTGSDPGGGPGSNPGSGMQPTPSIASTIDRQTVSTELFTSEMLNVTVTGAMGFQGAVTLTPTVVDAQGNPIADWTVAASPATLTLTENGNMSAAIMVTIPSDSAELAATVKVTATAGTLTADVSSAFTVAQQLHISFDAGTGTSTPHAHAQALPQNMNVKSGTSIIWINNDTIQHEVHGDNGIQHEGGPLDPGATYTVQLTATGQWYCHAHNESDGIRQISVE